jgi:ribosomal subunit interface protein
MPAAPQAIYEESKMDLTVQGKQMDVGDALRTHVSEKMADIDAKYFNRAFDVGVTFAPEGNAFIRTNISLKIGKDIQVTATAMETDAYVAFDIAATKIAKQMRRYKTRLRNHHQKIEQTPESEMLKARDYTLATDAASEDGEEDSSPETGSDPLIVAEMPMQIQKMSVSDAVMRLDLAGNAALLFRNPKNNAINMVYRRSDGNIGWVEPQDDLRAAE